MKTILVTAVLTLVFIVSLVFIEGKRTENLSKIALQYGTQTTQNTTSSTDSETVDTLEITIDGAVKNPGTYSIESGKTLSDLIDLAGGLNNNADEECFSLDYEIESKMSIYIPKTKTGKISINEAESDVLDMLPGIGETLANRIIEYRNENGEFELIDQIRNVEGIGDTLFNKIKDYIKL